MPILAAVVLVAGWVLQGPASPARATSAGPERTVALDQNTNYRPDVAFDGTNHLVVWTRGSGSFADVVGALVGPDGQVLPPGVIPIAVAPGQQSSPAVAFTGSSYVVVWEDGRNTTLDIFGNEVSVGGAVATVFGMPVSVAAGDQYSPAIAWSGTDPLLLGAALVAWTDTRSGGSDIYATNWTRGFLPNPGSFPIPAAPGGDQYRPAVTAIGATFLVAWTDTRGEASGDIWGARVSLTGVIGGTDFPISAATGSQVYPDVASDGVGALVVWQDRRNGSTDDVYATRWSPTGGVLDPGGIPVSTAPGSQSGPQVAWNGSYLVAWADYRNGAVANASGARVTTAGAVADPNGITIGTRQSDLVAAARGTSNTWAVAYATTGGSGVYLRTVSPK